MFYSTEVLRNNRSSLGMVWSAAWGRKLARSSVLNIKIDQTWYVLMLIMLLPYYVHTLVGVLQRVVEAKF